MMISPSLLVFIAATTVGCAAADSSSSANINCFLDHLGRIADCSDTWNSPDPNGTTTFNNQIAYENCVEGSETDKAACEAGLGDIPRDTLWIHFQQNIEACLDVFPDDDPIAQCACIESALDTYLDEVNDVLNPPDPDNACVGLVGGSRINTIESLSLAPSAVNGVYPIAMGSPVTISAGVSGTVGGGYDVAQKPCIKHAALAVIFDDGDDVTVQIVAADMVTSDGADFSVPLYYQKFIGTDDVTFLALFYDENGYPRFAETARVKIQASPVSGDWNRDGVKDQQDLIDYTNHFNAQKKRADVNQDQNIDYNDLSNFLNTFSD